MNRLSTWWHHRSRRGKIITATVVAFVVLGMLGSATRPSPPAAASRAPKLVASATVSPTAIIASVPPETSPTLQAQGSRPVTRADWGAGWPLTVDAGTLRCETGRAVVFQTPDGTKYALNGIASANPKYKDLEPIWATDPSGLTPKMDIGPLIQAGLALCP
jgi:hypothetical protein